MLNKFTPIWKDVGSNIALLLRRSDITQEEFATFLGVTPSIVSRYINGLRRIPIELFIIIGDLYLIPVNVLLFAPAKFERYVDREMKGNRFINVKKMICD